MALRLTEFFGYPVGDPTGWNYAASKRCPFIKGDCIKPEHGSCALEALQTPAPVICCPNRLYAGGFRILKQVADLAFGGDFEVITPEEARRRIATGTFVGNEVAAFGKYFHQELPLPKAGNVPGSFYMDWVLVRPDSKGVPIDLTALEVQTIDTTGNYKEQSIEAFNGNSFTDKKGRVPGYSDAGFNWENVNKRILPQVIYKGHALRREKLCKKGFFFACPQAVLDRIMDRLGGVAGLHQYPLQPGAVTFLAYDLGQPRAKKRRMLSGPASFTTTIDQVALAFTAPRNLPDAGVYELAASLALRGK